MYKSASQQALADRRLRDADGGGASGGKKKDDVVDAEFVDVDDKK